ncbi:MFS transporter [Kitasatospora sp. NA04385]|uniref:MFS transporter n=1 Tax=Kitasatospora sp. NA04385 TaxID=2742135 RepID=UPI00159098E0|nr:MFS transporter [Kitasatospora sp. NA04385]QKW20756.1 MFS transporter [Kitasatospora sp. NA04385]
MITERPPQEATLFGLLLGLLRGPGFRRLLTVRLFSQLSDGVFQASLAAYALFSPDKQSSPAEIAAALAVVTLPFSAIGPFTGVMLDRWRRRQVLLTGNLVRCGLCLLTALLLVVGVPRWVFYTAALLVMGINRFILAGLSASLPRVVEPSALVTANAVSPTLGAVVAAGGGGLGLAVGLLASGSNGNALTVALSALLYLVAALAVRPIAPDELGPDLRRELPPLRQALATAWHDLLAGLRHLLRECRPAVRALAAVSLAKFCYGVLTVVVLMLCRYTFNRADDLDGGLATLGLAVGLSAVGFFLAAAVSPWATRRFGLHGWMTLCLAGSAVFVPALGLTFREVPAMAAALLLGVVTQGTKICADTLVQESVEDEYRGRVFAIYDVLVNVAFVAAAAATALVLPLDGRSVPVMVGLSVLYAAGAVLYFRASRRP